LGVLVRAYISNSLYIIDNVYTDCTQLYKKHKVYTYGIIFSFHFISIYWHV